MGYYGKIRTIIYDSMGYHGHRQQYMIRWDTQGIIMAFFVYCCFVKAWRYTFHQITIKSRELSIYRVHMQ